ncbi:MAG: TFIIB-type zinc ribbon-containing protein [Candidatus Woesearchaeota archaeon]|nr:TFIIB-type zinc ribbon-containing protein [Candidatus Woesearchaeota archaeon]
MAVRLDEIKFCPECGTDNIVYNEKVAEIICQDCGAIFTELTPEQQAKYEQASEILKPLIKTEAKTDKAKKADVSKKAKKNVKTAKAKKQKVKSEKAAKKAKPSSIKKKKKGFLRFW